MLGLNQERTLMSAIIPPYASHINSIIAIAWKQAKEAALTTALFNSIEYDYIIRALGRSSFYNDSIYKLPYISEYREMLIARSLLLNCLTLSYADLWSECFEEILSKDGWLKSDSRLSKEHFIKLRKEWSVNTPVRSDYCRRELLVEIDVIVARALGISVEQLKAIYRIQFPVHKNYEDDTWYDANGRIIFTINKGLSGVGLARKDWEAIKDKTDGIVTQVITDDTMPGGPVERTIEYVAPFDCCDREKDYEEVWANFEKRFKE